jgi:hypothetical protein
MLKHFFLFSYENTKRYDFFIFLRDLAVCKTQKNSFFICRFLEIKLPLKVKRSFPSTSLNPKKKKPNKT